MPIYEFECNECGEVFEELMKIDYLNSPPCPICESVKTDKRMSMFGSIGSSSGGGNIGASSCTTSG